ncbi:MAG: photosystem II protein PsbQ [Cyanobacteria bacterium J06559_3]
MARFRSILGLFLAVIAVFVVGCGGTNVSQPTTYSADQIAQIELYNRPVVELRDRFPELEGYIQNKDWVDIRTFIHGPMGELRARLGRLTARLLPQDAKQAKALAEDLANRLERLDVAADEYNQVEAGSQYRKALDDFDAILSLVPQEDA